MSAADVRPKVQSRPSHVEKVARGGFFNLGGSVLSAFITLAFTVVITHALHQSGAGVFFALTAMFTLVFSVARLGVPTGVVYFIARYRAQGRVELLRPTMIAAVLPVAALASLLGLVGFIWAPDLTPILVHRSDPTTILLFRVLSIFLVTAAINDVGVGSTRGYGVMKPLVLIDRVGRPFVQLVLISLVVALGWRTPTSVGLAWVVPYLPACIVLLVWTDRLRRKTIRRAKLLGPPADADADTVTDTDTDTDTAPAPSGRASWRKEFPVFWRFTIPRTIGSIAQMVLQRADVILIGVILGPAQAAIYAAATRFLVFGQLGGGAISTTIQPKISALLAKGDRRGAAEVYRIATVWLMLLTWPIYLLFVVFRTDLLRIFGARYVVGADVIVVLSLAMLVATACGAVDVVLVMAGRSTWTMTNATVALVVDLSLNLILIPRIGIMGAALAWAAAILVNNIAPLTELALWLHLHPFGRATLLAALLPGVCFGVLPAAVILAAGRSLPLELVTAAIGGLIYLAGLWHWRDRLEIRALMDIRKTGRAQKANSLS